MHLIIALGNPGSQYTHTRHNAGFLAIDILAKRLGIVWKEKPDLKSEIATYTDEKTSCIFAKSTTFMNLSGEAATKLIKRYQVEAHHLLVIVDDIDLPLGTIRVRHEGSAGGHNGLKSLIAHLGTQQFSRIRIGVGAPPPRIPLEAWVLQKFTKDDMVILEPTLIRAADLAQHFLHGTVKEQTVVVPASLPPNHGHTL